MASATPYGQAGLHLASGQIDWLADTIKVALTDSRYKPDRNHAFRSDLSGEIADAALAGKTRTYDKATGATTLGADDPSWGPSESLTPRYAVYYKSSGKGPGKDELICWCDLGPGVYVANGTLTLKIASDGVVRIET